MASFADLAFVPPLGLNSAVAIDRCFQTMVHSLRHRRRHFVLEIFPCGHRVPKWIVSELVTGREGKGSSAKEGRSASRLTLDEVKSPLASLVHGCPQNEHTHEHDAGFYQCADADQWLVVSIGRRWCAEWIRLVSKRCRRRFSLPQRFCNGTPRPRP